MDKLFLICYNAYIEVKISSRFLFFKNFQEVMNYSFDLYCILFLFLLIFSAGWSLSECALLLFDKL